MVTIEKIIAREILDSRGVPTIEVDLFLNDSSCGRASVPSGASTGSLEAIELRDGDVKRYLGKGVLKAINNLNKIICPKILGKEILSQQELDELLIKIDGTENKSYLGANTILAVSLAFAKAVANSKKIPFYQSINRNISDCKSPKAFMNIINGGAHADNKIDIQEFMIIPNLEGSIRENIRIGSEVFHNLKNILYLDGHSTNVGDEGGFAPMLTKSTQALDYICKAIVKAGFTPGKEVLLALDCAASEFYREGRYFIEEKSLSSSELIEYYANLASNYPIISIEDPMAENDISGWKLITERLGDKIKLVGDDLFVTNPKILAKGIEDGLANSVLIKPNQIGTLTETIEAIEMAKKAGYESIISHRSGETEDTSISHIAVGCGVEYIKTGSLSRTDRVAKYNELIRIEESL